jgi:sigma-54-interacting transcriptional regulator
MDDATHATDFESLHEVCLHRVNLLLIGTAPRVDAVLARFKNLSDPPIGLCTLPGPLALPETGLVLMRDVAALTRDQQPALLDWMNAHRKRVQVISASTERLFARVTAGLFSDRLYYRLNTVLVYV